jgi:hypothetical protein
MIETIRALVRPATTLLFVVAFLWAALAGSAEAVKVLSGPTLGIVGYWFAERAAARREEST